jgi:methionyl aminopeptidase
MPMTRKTAAQIETMRRAGRLVAEVLALVESELRPGISTARLDSLAERHIRAAGATPSFKGYRGYPATICVSIDDEVVHGIPGDRVIRDGSVVSVDAGAIVDGWHADAARTFIVGRVPPDVERLVETTHLAMMAGIAAAVPGHHIGDISAAVEDVARPEHFGIVRQYVGHGIGTQMHEEPQVPNYRTSQRGPRLEAGHCLAIEPMLTLGSPEVVTRADDWTVATRDGSLAAHFEHTITVTERGPEILTSIREAVLPVSPLV